MLLSSCCPEPPSLSSLLHHDSRSPHLGLLNTTFSQCGLLDLNSRSLSKLQVSTPIPISTPLLDLYFVTQSYVKLVKFKMETSHHLFRQTTVNGTQAQNQRSHLVFPFLSYPVIQPWSLKVASSYLRESNSLPWSGMLFF